MCLIITILAAAVFSAAYIFSGKNSPAKKSVFTSMLMFWSAAIMWSVDSVASVISGGSFFDISVSDTILGFIILALGLSVFAFLSAHERIAKKAEN